MVEPCIGSVAEGLFDLGERYPEALACDRVECFVGAFEVERSMDVDGGLAGVESEGGGGGFQLVELAERFCSGGGGAVVVAIDDVAAEGFFLQFPHGVHVALMLEREGVLHEREDVVCGVVASHDGAGARRRDADFAAVLGITAEEEDAVVDDQAISGDFTEVGIIDLVAESGFGAGDEGDDDRAGF